MAQIRLSHELNVALELWTNEETVVVFLSYHWLIIVGMCPVLF